MAQELLVLNRREALTFVTRVGQEVLDFTISGCLVWQWSVWGWKVFDESSLSDITGTFCSRRRLPRTTKKLNETSETQIGINSGVNWNEE